MSSSELFLICRLIKDNRRSRVDPLVYRALNIHLETLGVNVVVLPLSSWAVRPEDKGGVGLAFPGEANYRYFEDVDAAKRAMTTHYRGGVDGR